MGSERLWWFTATLQMRSTNMWYGVKNSAKAASYISSTPCKKIVQNITLFQCSLYFKEYGNAMKRGGSTPSKLWITSDLILEKKIDFIIKPLSFGNISCPGSLLQYYIYHLPYFYHDAYSLIQSNQNWSNTKLRIKVTNQYILCSQISRRHRKKKFQICHIKYQMQL